MEQPSFTPCTTCGSSAGAGASFPPPRVFGSAPFSHEETARIQMDLSRKLPPDCIATRSGGSAGRVSYVEGWKAIELANEIFGFNGWSSTVLNMSIDYLENAAQNPNEQKWSVGVSCTIRVTLRDGAYREDTGFGLCENMRTKGQALEKARKESATDALKRALRLLGNALGNCLSDKDFMRQVGSLPVNRKVLSRDDVYQKSQPTMPMITAQHTGLHTPTAQVVTPIACPPPPPPPPPPLPPLPLPVAAAGAPGGGPQPWSYAPNPYGGGGAGNGSTSTMRSTTGGGPPAGSHMPFPPGASSSTHVGSPGGGPPGQHQQQQQQHQQHSADQGHAGMGPPAWGGGAGGGGSGGGAPTTMPGPPGQHGAPNGTGSGMGRPFQYGPPGQHQQQQQQHHGAGGGPPPQQQPYGQDPLKRPQLDDIENGPGPSKRARS